MRVAASMRDGTGWDRTERWLRTEENENEQFRSVSTCHSEIWIELPEWQDSWVSFAFSCCILLPLVLVLEITHCCWGCQMTPWQIFHKSRGFGTARHFDSVIWNALTSVCTMREWLWLALHSVLNNLPINLNKTGKQQWSRAATGAAWGERRMYPLSEQQQKKKTLNKNYLISTIYLILFTTITENKIIWKKIV